MLMALMRRLVLKQRWRQRRRPWQLGWSGEWINGIRIGDSRESGKRKSLPRPIPKTGQQEHRSCSKSLGSAGSQPFGVLFRWCCRLRTPGRPTTTAHPSIGTRARGLPSGGGCPGRDSDSPCATRRLVALLLEPRERPIGFLESWCSLSHCRIALVSSLRRLKNGFSSCSILIRAARSSSSELEAHVSSLFAAEASRAVHENTVVVGVRGVRAQDGQAPFTRAAARGANLRAYIYIHIGSK